MRQLFFVYLCAVFVLGSFPTARSIAQGPAANLDHYRLVARKSTLHQTGGFGGFDITYRVMGEYDFTRGSNTGGPKFVNPEMWGTILSDWPAPAYVVDVDQIFNLKGLEGKPLPILAPPTVAPFDAFKFRGLANDGSSIDLVATRFGPWMYLSGWTTPPPGSADFFEYQIRALARSGPFADFNSDDVVDASDYALLRKSGNSGGDALSAGAGLAEWRQQFGESVPDFAAMDAMIGAALSGLATGAAVPEPSLAALIAVGSVSTLLFRRRKPTVDSRYFPIG